MTAIISSIRRSTKPRFNSNVDYRFTCGETFPDNNTKNLGLFFSWRKGIVRKNPSFDTEECANCCLFDMWVFCFEFIRKTETDDRKTGDITFWIVLGKILVVVRAKLMNVRETDII